MHIWETVQETRWEEAPEASGVGMAEAWGPPTFRGDGDEEMAEGPVRREKNQERVLRKPCEQSA